MWWWRSVLLVLVLALLALTVAIGRNGGQVGQGTKKRVRN